MRKGQFEMDYKKLSGKCPFRFLYHGMHQLYYKHTLSTVIFIIIAAIIVVILAENSSNSLSNVIGDEFKGKEESNRESNEESNEDATEKSSQESTDQSENSSTPKGMSDEAIASHIEQAYIKSAEDYEKAVKKHYQTLEESLKSQLEPFESKARASFQRCVHEDIILKNIIRIIWLKAQDIYYDDDQNRAEQWIYDHLVAPTQESIRTFQAGVEQSISRFDSRIQAAQNEFSAQFQTALKTQWEETDRDLRFGQIIGAKMVLNGANTTDTTGRAVVAGLFPIEVIAMSTGTVELLKILKEKFGSKIVGTYNQYFKKYFHTISKRFAKRMGTSAALAASDGPLPFLDAAAGVLAIGFSVYGIYEFYEMPSDFRNKLMSGFEDGLDQTRQKVLGETLSNIENRMNQHIESVKQNRGDAVQQIMKQ